MFTDKNRPQLSTVSTVHGFYDAPGVKTVCTVDTVDSSAQLNTRFNAQLNRPHINGYILTMTTATGTWYYSGFHSENTRLAWTQDIDRVKVMASKPLIEKSAAKHHAEITDLFGPAIIGHITARPVTIVNHRNILIDEEQP